MKRFFRSLFLAGLLFAAFGMALSPAKAQTNGLPEAVLLTDQGPLTPVLAQYIERGLQIAADRQAEVVILQIDTPGGSVDLMNRIVQIIRASEVPVVVYVAPRNAMAGSAGTIITLAGHVAAMAPETTIGAASPVGSQGEDIGEAMESKVKEMLKASVRALAARRSPEAIRLAEETIEKATAVTVEEALEIGLVDLKANDLKDLLAQLDGREVALNGGEVVLNTRNAIVTPVATTFIEQVLKLLVDPNLVFLLLAIGVQAILIELSSPGGWVAGFIGVLCLMLAIYGLGILPVNWFGFLFLLLAFVLFILELKTPTVGALTAAGAISFVAGALILFNSVRMPGFPTVSVPLVIGTSIVLAASFLGVITFALRAQREPVLTGREALPGRFGYVSVELAPRGQVQVGGELWSAELVDSEEPLPAGARVRVEEVDGLQLRVRKA